MFKQTRKVVLVFCLFVVQFLTTSAQQSESFIRDGKAIGGYDPVAFFTDSSAQLGQAAFAYHWQGGDWYFTSAAHRDSFVADPERFAPQFGGYCAFGASRGYKAPTQINTWAIVNQKLYFNYNQQVKRLWNEKRDALIPLAEQQWIEVRKQ